MTGVMLAAGALHGFVVWKLVFRLVGPVARIVVGDRSGRLRVSSAICHIASLVFLLALGFVILAALGRMIADPVPRPGGGALVFGSFCGFLISALLPRVEADIRNRSSRK